MSRELITLKWCDVCQRNSVKTEAAHTFTVGMVAGEAAPALHTVDLCDEHESALAVLVTLTTDAAPYRAPKPSAPPPVSAPALRGVDLAACEICGKQIARTSLIGHVWAKHTAQGERPPQPTVCPDCRKTYDTGQGMAVHRATVHGFNALAAAYAAARR